MLGGWGCFFEPCFGDAGAATGRFMMDDRSNSVFGARFREESFVKKEWRGDTQSVKVLAGSQPSLPQFNALLAADPLMGVVVDLRREPHFFVNGHGVMLGDKGGNGWMSPEQTIDLEERLMAWVRAQKVIFVYKKVNVGGVKIRVPIKLHPHTVFTEQAWAHARGVDYFRLFIPDHCPPTTQQAEDFIRFYQGLGDKVSLYIHCRGGKGRTTTFMAMIDMMHNAGRDSFETILARQQRRHGADLMRTTKGHKGVLAARRRQFLMNFYREAKRLCLDVGDYMWEYTGPDCLGWSDVQDMEGFVFPDNPDTRMWFSLGYFGKNQDNPHPVPEHRPFQPFEMTRVHNGDKNEAPPKNKPAADLGAQHNDQAKEEETGPLNILNLPPQRFGKNFFASLITRDVLLCSRHVLIAHL